MSAGTPPNYLVQKIVGAEHAVHKYLQIMARRRITMYVNASSWLQNPMEFNQPWSHHSEIGEQICVTEKCPEGDHGFCDMAACFNRIHVGLRCGLIPLPRVAECLNLCSRPLPVLS